MPTLEDLANGMKSLAQGLPAKANQLKKDIASTVNFDLLQTTPVDTGQAVSNWIVQNASASEETRPPFAPNREGYMKQSSGARAWTHRVDAEVVRQANVAPALALAKETINQAQPGEPIHITNNLDYIQALDEGHSSQAENFVERAIILGTDLQKRAKIL